MPRKRPAAATTPRHYWDVESDELDSLSARFWADTSEEEPGTAASAAASAGPAGPTTPTSVDIPPGASTSPNDRGEAAESDSAPMSPVSPMSRAEMRDGTRRLLKMEGEWDLHRHARCDIRMITQALGKWSGPQEEVPRRSIAVEAGPGPPTELGAGAAAMLARAKAAAASLPELCAGPGLPTELGAGAAAVLA
ncbi:unnamed protein product, partial [Symbiodinium sp. CCMP2456]